MIGGDGVEDEVEAAGVLLHLVGVAGDDDFVGAEAERVFLLARRGREDDDVRSEAHGANFTPMWPSPPRPTTPTFLPLVTPQWRMRRVGRDAGAEQRRGSGEIEVRRDAQDEVLIDDDAVGVAAVGDAAEVLVRGVVGERHVRAELLEVPLCNSGRCGPSRPCSRPRRGRRACTW